MILQLLGLALLMAGSAFFSGAETAFSALGKSRSQRIRGDGRSSSGYIVAFLDNPRRFFITVLFGNILVNVAFVTITGSLIYYRLFGNRHAALASVVAVAVELVALLLFGEITPKTYAIRHAEGFARFAALPLWLFSSFIFPFRKLLRWVTDATLRLLGIGSGLEDRHRISGEELRTFVREAEESGVIDEHEAEMIGNIFEMADIDAREVMTPRTDMVCVEVSTTIREAFEKAREAGYSRLPVYRGEVDSICGIFFVKDLPRWRSITGCPVSIEQLTIEQFLLSRSELCRRCPGNEDTLVRQPLFSYEAKKVGGLLVEMSRKQQHMAILLDEYGGVAGLVTIQDIVEEVVGEIIEGHSGRTEQAIVGDPDDVDAFLVAGLASVRSVNRRCDLELPVDRAETIGGYVVSLTGSIAATGDRVEDPDHGVEFEVVATDGPRVERVRMRRRRSTPDQGSGLPSTVSLLVPVLFAALATAPGATSGAASGVSVTVLLLGALFVASLLFIGFFAGSETAVVSASREHIAYEAEQGNARAAVVRSLLDRPDRFLATVLVGTNLATAIAGQTAVVLAGHALPGHIALQKALNTAILTPLILVFCEILPKTLFHARADALALRSAPALRLASRLLWPIVALVSLVTRWVTRDGGAEEQDAVRVTREELKLLAAMGGTGGQLQAEELAMIRNVLSLESRTIHRVMVPLVNMAALPADAPTARLFEMVAETGYSRIAVFEGRIDNVVGYVNVRDVLFSRAESPTIAPYVRRDVGYEPESRQALSLLRQLRVSGHPLAIVVDEYGGVTGLVTTEDLVEEIMGEIRDERDDDADAEIRRLSSGVYECSGRTEVLEFNRYAGLRIPPGNYETVAGYVLSLTQRIPRQGEVLDADDLRVTVLESDVRRVSRVRVQVRKRR